MNSPHCPDLLPYNPGFQPRTPVSGVRLVVPKFWDSGLPKTPSESRYRRSRLVLRDRTSTHPTSKLPRNLKNPHDIYIDK